MPNLMPIRRGLTRNNVNQATPRMASVSSNANSSFRIARSFDEPNQRIGTCPTLPPQARPHGQRRALTGGRRIGE